MQTKPLDQPNQPEQQSAPTEPKQVNELVDVIDQNIESILELHIHAESKVSQHQRMIERITAFLGRPAFFYFTLIFVGSWIIMNLATTLLQLRPFDPPPFYWLQGDVGLCALLVSTAVLITQNRQQKIADQRRQLDLQVNLLVERKVTKLISQIDALRRDLPDIENKTDPEIEALKESVDPKDVIHTLHQTWKNTTQEEL